MDESEIAKQFIKKNKQLLYRKFINIGKLSSITDLSAYFMAGSPGAGKTEWSKSFIKTLIDKEPNRTIVRIDPDEIREFLPNYIPEQADIFQGATALGVEKILDYVLKNNQDFLLDGTFSNYEVSYKNVKRSLNKGRKVAVIYIYQDPLIAWDFTKKRAFIEKRIIPKQAFIRSFFKAHENVTKIKKEFGNSIEIWLVKRNYHRKTEKAYLNIDKVDNYIKNEYNKEKLKKLL